MHICVNSVQSFRPKPELRAQEIPPPVLRQFVTFAGVGAIATALHYMVLVTCASGFALDPVLSATLGYLAGAVISYWINYTVTFRSTRRHRDAIVRFGAVAVVGLIINTATVNFGISELSLHYFLAQVLATLIVLIWNFIANKIWTF